MENQVRSGVDSGIKRSSGEKFLSNWKAFQFIPENSSMRSSRKIILLFILGLFNLLKAYGQREILPLPLNKLDRDSLSKVIFREEEENDYQALGDLYGGMFTFFYLSEFRDSAIIYASKAEEALYKAGDSAKYYFTLLHLGELSIPAFDISQNYWQKALNYYTRTGNYKLLAHALNNISRLYEHKNDSVNSLKYYHMSVEANRKGQDTFLAVVHNTTRIKLFMEKNELNSAIHLLHKNIGLVDITKLFGNSEEEKSFWKGILYNMLGECYYRQKNFASTIKYMKEAERYDQTLDYSDHNLLRYRFLAESYINLEDKDSAIKYVELFYDNAYKIIFNYDPVKLNELTLKYETEKKQRQIEQLENQTELQLLTVSSQRKWNRFIVIMLVVVFLGGLIIITTLLQKRKLQKQQAIEHVRSKIAMDIHDEIGSQLTKISLLSQHVKLYYEKKKKIDARAIEKITAVAKEVVGNIGEIIWAVNPKHDNLESVLAYLRAYIANFFEQTNIDCTIDFPDEVAAITISPDLKHNLFLVIKESLNNIIKHAEATEVILHFSYTHQLFRFEISDNGKGLDGMSTCDFGNGLVNMKNRMETVNGKFEIQSAINTGTKIILEGRFGK